MANNNENIEGRSVFSVEITSQGVLVKTLFLTKDGKLIDAPAVFPTPDYAFEQIDSLKKIVSQKFSDAVKMTGEAMTSSSNLVKNLKK